MLKTALVDVDSVFKAYEKEYNSLVTKLTEYKKESSSKRKDEQKEKLNASKLLEKLEVLKIEDSLNLPTTKNISNFDTNVKENDKQKEFTLKLKEILDVYNEAIKEFNDKYHNLVDTFKQSDKLLKVKADKSWGTSSLPKSDKALELKF